MTCHYVTLNTLHYQHHCRAILTRKPIDANLGVQLITDLNQTHEAHLGLQQRKNKVKVYFFFCTNLWRQIKQLDYEQCVYITVIDLVCCVEVFFGLHFFFKPKSFPEKDSLQFLVNKAYFKKNKSTKSRLNYSYPPQISFQTVISSYFILMKH